MLNKKGPKTEPCQIPDIIFSPLLPDDPLDDDPTFVLCFSFKR